MPACESELSLVLQFSILKSNLRVTTGVHHRMKERENFSLLQYTASPLPVNRCSDGELRLDARKQ